MLTAAIALQRADVDEFHGYALNKQLEEGGGKSFTVSTLYRCLNRLEDMGLLVSESRPAEGRGPNRRAYRLTPDGVAAATQVIPDEAKSGKRIRLV